MDAHRHHARRVREEKALKSGRNYISAIQSVDDPRAQGGGVAGTNQHGSFSQIGVGRVGDGAPPEDAGSRENLLDILAQQMEEESSGIGAPSNEEFAQLISLIIATNSADACAQSIEALPELIEDLMEDALDRNPYLDRKLADKIAVTSIADLVRISESYAALRDTWIVQLVEALAASLEELCDALRPRFSQDSPTLPDGASVSGMAISSTVSLTPLRAPFRISACLFSQGRATD